MLRLTGIDIARCAPGQLSLEDQVGEVGQDPVVGEVIRRSVVMLGQSHDSGDVRRVGASGETAHGRVADYAVAEIPMASASTAP
jgi:hypothetical protein